MGDRPLGATVRAALSGQSRRCPLGVVVRGTGIGMLCGAGMRDGRPVAYAAQCGTAIRRAGYRTAARVIRLGLPVLTPIDPTRPDQLRLRPQDPVDLGVARSVVGPTRALGG